MKSATRARSFAGALAATLCLSAAPATADRPLASAAEAADVQHQFSLTISPIHLALPVVEVTGEYRLMDEVGIAGVLGYGQIDVETTSSTGEKTTDGLSVIEAGVSGRYYVLGSFIHGMQLGIEALYVHISGDDIGGTSVSGAGQGLSVGPFAGYKIATNIGFTFDAQLGYAFFLAGAEAEDDDTGESDSESSSGHGVLLNLNVGWSF